MIEKKEFKRLFKLFTPQTQGRILDINYIALRLLWFKYKRKKKKFNEKEKRKKKNDPNYTIPDFKFKDSDVGHAYVQAYFRSHHKKEFYVTKEPDIDYVEADEEGAKQTFISEIAGDVSDYYGRKVIIPQEGYRYFYKDSEGKHVEATTNFKRPRAKRMRWIRKVIKETREIHIKTESWWRTNLYIGGFYLPCYRKNINYFVVVVREEANRELVFKTAYYYENLKDLLHAIEPTHPHWAKVNP